MNTTKLGKINDILTIAVVLLGLYILLSPMYPVLVNWYQREHASKTALTQAVASGGEVAPPSQTSSEAPQGNRLVIPTMNLDEPIYEGISQYTVHKGVWKRPKSSDPGAGSNTVLVGHRYSFNPAIKQPFFSLDIVTPGDVVGVYWNGTLFTYTVTKVMVVEPEAIEIEAPTDQEQLTIYTCTPLWTSNQRLVVIAKPIKDAQ